MTTKKILEAKRPDGQPVFDFTNLEQFSAICYAIQTVDDMDVAQSILRRSHHLTTVHLSRFARAIVSSMNTLKKLTFENIMDEELADVLSGLCDELEEMVGKNVLEDLEIFVFILPETDYETGDEWGRLDEILGKSGWSALKRVSLEITIWTYGRPEDDDLERDLRALPQRQFPNLSSGKTVDFHFDVKQVFI
ncbi:hypothetical protein BDZ97DRAFT_1800859 [Flammula alnicola]|nr:hypothetical protein BDZ97DRAFT_1800859 [Flammula alnicola]